MFRKQTDIHNKINHKLIVQNTAKFSSIRQIISSGMRYCCTYSGGVTLALDKLVSYN